MNKIAPILVLTAFLAVAPTAKAQDLGSTLQSVGAPYAEAYVQPLVDAFGADINSGLFHTARVGGGLIPMLDLYLGVKAFGALIPASQQSLDLTYTAPGVFRVDGEQYLLDVQYQISGAPTVFGDSGEPGTVETHVYEVVSPGPDGVSGTADDVIIDEQRQLELLPGLINTQIAPLLVPQLRIGSAFGTDLMIRYLPRLEREDLGSAGFFGLGVRHSISQYLPLMPFNVAAQVSMQRLGIADANDDEVLSARMWALSLIGSKSFVIASVYGGLQLESTSVDVDYLFVDPSGDLPSQKVDFSMNGSNRVRAVAGVGFNMGPMLVNFDYSLGSMNVISAGVGISL